MTRAKAIPVVTQSAGADSSGKLSFTLPTAGFHRQIAKAAAFVRKTTIPVLANAEWLKTVNGSGSVRASFQDAQSAVLLETESAGGPECEYEYKTMIMPMWVN